MKKSDIFWQTYLNLEKEALEISKYIFFTDEKIINSGGFEKSEFCSSQLETFSPYIADLLVRCCVQIEAISKELYFNIGGIKQRGDKDLFFDEDCLKEIDKKWKIGQKVVLVVSPSFNFTKEENKILKPLKNAHKRQGTYWEKAYQAVKHDRYSSLYRGNVKAFIHALGALYLLNIYFRNDSWITKYQDISKLDYSLGSVLFSVNPPKTNELWYGNNPIESESPFVAKYKESDYKHIEAIQQEEHKALTDYWVSQPELDDPDFQAQLQKAYEREKEDSCQKVMPLCELAKYRLHKLIPNTLSFEVQKERLLNSEAWNCKINQINNHLQPSELTEENLQKEINSVASRWGIDITNRFQKMEWFNKAINSNIQIFIP